MKTLRDVTVLAVLSVMSLSQGGPSGTLVISNMNDNTATIIAPGTGAVLATLATGVGPHEVAISRDGRLALVSNYGVRDQPGSSLTLIDVGTRALIRTIDLGSLRRPHGMAFLPGDTVVAVTSEASRAVVFVRLADGRVVRTLPTNARTTHMLSMSTDGARFVTANISDGTISVFDPMRDSIARSIKVARQPEGIAITPDGKFAWVGSNQDSVVLIVDLTTGLHADTLRGFGLPYRIGISRDGKRAVVSDPAKANVRVFDVATRREVHVISFARDSLVATAEVPGSPSPEGVAVSADGKWAFVTLQGRNRVAIIDLDAGRIVRYGVTGTWSDGIGYSPR